MKKCGQFLRSSTVVLCALTGSACSFLFTSSPPENAAALPPMARVECTSSKTAPVIDTVIGAIQTVRVIAAIGVDDSVYADSPISRETDLALGLGLGALFFGSAAYGYHVTGQCRALKLGHLNAPTSPGAFSEPGEVRRGRRSRAPEPDPSASLAAVEAPPNDIPKTVSSFAFATPIGEAEKTCASTQRAWDLQGTVASCGPKTEGGAGEKARLEFELGSLSTIVILHEPADGAFNRDYDALHAKLRGQYGRPQVARAQSRDCATAMVECMKRGDRPKGSTWFLPHGRVDLLPLWRDESALLEERYKREEPPPP